MPSNIAEGKGRYSADDVIHFMVQARGSLLEIIAGGGNTGPDCAHAWISS
ncbi:MAG: four helix bundle protein [Terriglobales bacterium]